MWNSGRHVGARSTGTEEVGGGEMEDGGDQALVLHVVKWDIGPGNALRKSTQCDRMAVEGEFEPTSDDK